MKKLALPALAAALALTACADSTPDEDATATDAATMEEPMPADTTMTEPTATDTGMADDDMADDKMDDDMATPEPTAT